jgi:hypothetical protein
MVLVVNLSDRCEPSQTYIDSKCALSTIQLFGIGSHTYLEHHHIDVVNHIHTVFSTFSLPDVVDRLHTEVVDVLISDVRTTRPKSNFS